MRTLTLFLLAASTLGAQALPNAVPMPTPEVQFVDQNGLPLNGAKLCTYAAGTSTPLATYTDSTAGTPNTNPVILDVSGRASVWVGPQLYKFVLRVGGDGTCTTGAVQWTQDNVADTTLYFTNFVKTAGTATLVSYTSTATGAVATTVAAKLGETVSVKDFGAVGNGTTDDTAAIQLALNSCKAVYIPEGTYKVTAQLNVTCSNPIIYGLGIPNHTVLKASGSAFNMLDINPSGGGTPNLTGFSLNGNSVANNGIFCETNGCFQGKFDNMEIAGVTGSPGAGFNTSGTSAACYSMEMTRLSVTGNNIGLNIVGNCQNFTLSQSLIYQNSSIQIVLGSGNGFPNGVRAYTLRDDDIEGNGSSGATVYGIKVNGVDPLLIDRCYFESSDNATSADINVTAGSRITINSSFSNGNVVANHAILLNAPVEMVMSNSFYFNTTDTTFTNLNTTNENVTFIGNVGLNVVGATPSSLYLTVPAYTNPFPTFLGTLQVNTSIFTPLVDTRLSGTGKGVMLMNSTGASNGKISLGTDTLNGGSWCLGYGAADDSVGTPSWCWDAHGHYWGDGNKVYSPPGGATVVGVGQYWNVDAGGGSAVFFFEQNKSGTPDARNWNRRILTSSGNYQFVSAADDGTAQNVAMEFGRNGGVAFGGGTPCSNTAVCAPVVVSNGMQLTATGPAPTCNSTSRGMFWYAPGGTGVKDVVEVCAKDASNVYAWRSIY